MDVMTTQAEMTFKCTSRSSRVHGTNRKLVYDFLLVVVTFAVGLSRNVCDKFDVNQFNDLEISPRSSTVASRESCRVACRPM